VSVPLDASVLSVLEPAKEFHHRGLAAAGFANDGCTLTWGHSDVDVSEHLVVWCVPEVETFCLDCEFVKFDSDFVLATFFIGFDTVNIVNEELQIPCVRLCLQLVFDGHANH